MSSQTESDIEEDLNYTPKISSPGNYRKFLDFSGSGMGSLSDEETGHSSGNEGYIDDELYREELLPEEGVFVGSLNINKPFRCYSMIYVLPMYMVAIVE